METSPILPKVTSLLANLLENDSLKLEMRTTAHDVEGWDSLIHMQFIVAIEKHFGIRFTSAEIQAFNNVGDTCRTVQEKLTAKR